MSGVSWALLVVSLLSALFLFALDNKLRYTAPYEVLWGVLNIAALRYAS